ncbi:MAG: anaerobic ribonucleoside-triphosphate reductase activating protein [Candidatus Omnitrophota bacterium]
MKLAGLQKLSLVDFPGYLSCAVFVQGCNFHCPYCQNPGLIPKTSGEEKVTEKEIFDFLKNRKSMLEGVVITGGEPVILRDLPIFINQIKKLGYKVKLDTNGSEPDVVKALLGEGLIDYIALDVKTSLSKYSLLTERENIKERISESVEHIKRLSEVYEFRTTCVPGIVDEEDFWMIGKMVKGAQKYCLQQFRPFKTYKEDFQKITPYQKNDFLKFQSILEKFVNIVEIRGIE